MPPRHSSPDSGLVVGYRLACSWEAHRPPETRTFGATEKSHRGPARSPQAGVAALPKAFAFLWANSKKVEGLTLKSW